VDGDSREVHFLITDHEEMWSFGDMIEAIPFGVGTFYRKIFRRLFAKGFVATCTIAEYIQRKIFNADITTGRNWKALELKKEANLGSPSFALTNLW